MKNEKISREILNGLKDKRKFKFTWANYNHIQISIEGKNQDEA